MRKENADLREENRRLKARCGDIVAKDEPHKEHGHKAISDMTNRELAAALQANEVAASVLECPMGARCALIAPPACEHVLCYQADIPAPPMLLRANRAHLSTRERRQE